MSIKSNMLKGVEKCVEKCVEKYVEEMLLKLSGKYGLELEEVKAYLKTEEGVEKKEKRGRPEKKAKKVLTKGGMVDDKIMELMKTMTDEEESGTTEVGEVGATEVGEVAEVVKPTSEEVKPAKEKKTRAPKKKTEVAEVAEVAAATEVAEVLSGELQEEEIPKNEEEEEEEIDVVEITYNGSTYNCDPDSMKVYDSESEFVGYWTGSEIEYRAEE